MPKRRGTIKRRMVAPLGSYRDRRKWAQGSDWHANRSRTAEEASYRGLHNRMVQQARHRGIAWNLEFEDFMLVVVEPCIWCLAAPFDIYNSRMSKNDYTQRKKDVIGGWVKYNGLDRMDNEDSYHMLNVLPCCRYCNWARNVRSMADFAQWLEQIGKIYAFRVD